MHRFLEIRASIFDGEEYFEGGSVVVDRESGKIADVGRGNEIERPRDSEVIDVPGSTILPGMIDAHVHFFGSNTYDVMEWVTTPEPLVLLRSVNDMQRLLYSGFTTVRDAGTRGGTYLSMAEREGAIVGPRVLTCVKAICQTGGDEVSSYYCDGPWECTKAVRAVIRDGADFVKVYASEGFPKHGKGTQFNVEELKAIVNEAHLKGLKVAAHTVGETSLANVTEAGVDSIEHGVGLNSDLAERIRGKGIYYVPTEYTLNAYLDGRTNFSSHGIGLSSATITEEERALMKHHMTHDMEIAVSHGLKIVTGSDRIGWNSPNPHGQSYTEVAFIAKFAGNKEALKSATSVAAECCGIERSAGRIRKGFDADIVIVKGNPIADITALAPWNIVHVLKAGKIYTPNA